MIKLIYVLHRLPHLSVQEFQTYWRQAHGPVAARIPGVKRYVQCHTLPSAYKGDRVPAYDGAAELWWEDWDSYRAAMRSPEAAAAREDERKFIDHSRSVAFVTEEKPVVE